VSTVGNSLFESGHSWALLTKVRQRARNAMRDLNVKLVSAWQDSAAEVRNLGRVVTVMID